MRTFLISSFLVLGLCACAFADSPASENAVILGPNMGSAGITPATEIIKVRYGYEPGTPGLAQHNVASGDIMVWDSTSGDGYTVSVCTTSFDTMKFAGIAVQSILTADSSNVEATKNIGYIAVRGVCLARIIIDQATNGDGLLPIRVDAARPAFITVASLAHAALGGAATSHQSNDVGVLLKESAATGLGTVYLR